MKMRSSVTEMYLAWLSKTDWRRSGSRGVRATAQHSMLWGPVTISPWIEVALDHMVDYALITPDCSSDGR